MSDIVLLIGIFLCAGALSFGCSHAVRRFAVRARIIDKPDSERKLQKTPVPMMGGLALFFTILLTVVVYALIAPDYLPDILDSHVTAKNLFGLLLGAGILVIGGIADERWSLKPHHQLIAPILAIGVVIAGGIGVQHVSNPFTKGVIDLTTWNILLFWWDGLPRYVTVFADILTFVWLMGMMYTTKLLDGLDGLVSGVTVIGAGIIAVVSTILFINEPTALLATITAGAFAGFLLLNLPPARLYLGESGSLLAGYMLGVLSILSGAKFATALLIVGIPVLDAARVIVERIRNGQSPFTGDRRHLHFRLQHLGFSPRQALAFYLVMAVSFGFTALILQRFEKFIAVTILFLFSLGFFLFIKRIEDHKSLTR